MTEQNTTAARVLRAGDGPILGSVGGVRNRFLIDGRDTDHRFAVVQHLIAPHSLAAPMHRHHDEDEYTYVLSGRIGAVSNGGIEELFRSFGSLVEPPTPDELAERAAPYRCEADFEATMPLLERYGLSF